MKFYFYGDFFDDTIVAYGDSNNATELMSIFSITTRNCSRNQYYLKERDKVPAAGKCTDN